MIADSIALCERTLAKLRETGRAEPPPVVAAPSWWLDMVRRHGGGQPDDEVDTFCGCKVVATDAQDPALVAADGGSWCLTPAWARDKAGGHGQDH